MEFERKDLPDQHYIYVEKEVPYGPEIADAMGAAFGEVFSFVGTHGLTPLSMPMSVYPGMDAETLRFHGGVIVSKEDAAKASGTVKAGLLPACEVMHTTHVGPYDGMNKTHQAMWTHMKDNDIPQAMPIWEIYADDPGQVAEQDLRTEIYCKIGS